MKANLARKPAGDDRLQVKGVYAGECDIAVGNTYYMGAMLKNDKEPEQKAWANSVNILFPNTDDRGTHVNISGAVMAKHAPHKDNAMKLLEFLASDKGQEMYADVNNEYPVKEGVPWSPLVKSWGDFKPDPISLNEIAGLAQEGERARRQGRLRRRSKLMRGQTMSFHKKIDRQMGGKPSHRAFVPPRSGAEWLVGVGFRCWLAGYDTGDIACWENGWNEYARALGTERAKRAVTELACWVRAVRASASRKIEYSPVGCPGFCADECMAISLIAASQHHRCPAMRACALALTGSDLVEPVIDAANAFADALQDADQRLSQDAVAALMVDGARAASDGLADDAANGGRWLSAPRASALPCAASWRA